MADEFQSPVTWADVRRSTAYHDVEQFVGSLAPAPGSSPADFAAYYRRAAAEYDRVANQDTAHRHEAQADATIARKHEAIHRSKLSIVK